MHARLLALGLAGALLNASPMTPARADTAMSVDFTDFKTLSPSTSPNRWLVAPSDSPLSAQADATGPEFAVAAEQLAPAWIGIVRKTPRVQVLGTSADGLQVEAEQRSAVFGFVDRISFRAVPLGPDRSTVMAYSRSQVGYWDLGVNKSRLSDWLGALQAQVASEPQ